MAQNETPLTGKTPFMADTPAPNGANSDDNEDGVPPVDGADGFGATNVSRDTVAKKALSFLIIMEPSRRVPRTTVSTNKNGESLFCPF